MRIAWHCLSCGRRGMTTVYKSPQMSAKDVGDATRKDHKDVSPMCSPSELYLVGSGREISLRSLEEVRSEDEVI